MLETKEEAISFRNSLKNFRFLRNFIVLTNKDAEKENFFESFNESQKAFQEKRECIQNRINQLQTNIANYLDLNKVHNESKDLRFLEVKSTSSEIYKTDKKNVTENFFNTKNLGFCIIF